MAINKRLRYFRTEEEYQEFYEQQRQACDDGTLELLETTVCCITHGDTDTPDEYLPSHEPGDENVIMHYNANDDIRYIPFINPMWTIRGVYIENATPINALKAMVTLPDVIDGNQLTTIPSDFVRYLNNFPKFNVRNVTTLTYASLKSFNVTSKWPSLISLSVQRARDTDADVTQASAPIFANGVLNAPLLRSVNYNEDAYSGMNYYHRIEQLPLFSSQNITSFNITLSSTIIDLNNVFTSTGNLANLSLQTQNLTTSGYPYYNTHTIRLRYDGLGLTWTTVYLSGVESNKIVNFDVTGNIQNISINNIMGFYDCDFFLSSIANVPLPQRLRFVGCLDSGQNLRSITDWFSSGNRKARSIVPTGGVDFRNCDFDEYTLDINTSGSNTKYVTIISNTALPPDVIYNITAGAQTSLSLQGDFNDVTINVDENVPYLRPLSIAVSSGFINKLIIPGGKIVATGFYVGGQINSVSEFIEWYYPLASKYSLYLMASPLFTFCRLHVQNVEILLQSQIDIINLVIERTTFPETAYGRCYLMFRVTNDIAECNISYNLEETDIIGLSVVLGSTITIQTVITVLSAVDPALSSTTFTVDTAYLSIYEEQYTEIERNYPTAFATIQKFKSMDIIYKQ